MNKLVSLRKSVGLSQKEAAEKLGISRMELYRIETGKTDVTLNIVFRMILVYRLQPWKLSVQDLHELFPGSFRKFASWANDYMFRKLHNTQSAHSAVETVKNQPRCPPNIPTKKTNADLEDIFSDIDDLPED